MNNKAPYIGIAQYIPVGTEADAVHMDYLASIMHRSDRQIRQDITLQRKMDQLNNSEYVLVSGKFGYVYTDNPVMISKYQKMARKRSASGERSAASTERS